MKICVLAYNFRHKKTQDVLVELYLNNIKVHTVFAANKVKLNYTNQKKESQLTIL